MDRVALLKYAMKKQAVSPGQVGRQAMRNAPFWQKAMALLGGGVAAGTASVGTMRGIQGVENALARTGKGNAFSNMLELDNELNRMNKNNPKQVKTHFNTLFRFAPEMAKDPLVASSFVKSTVQHDMLSHKTVQDLIKSRKDLKDTAKPSGVGFGTVSVDPMGLMG